MRHIKQYESFFGLFKDKPTPENWKDVFNIVKSEFEKNKSGKKSSMIDTSDSKIDGTMINCVNYNGKFMISLVFSSKNNEYSLSNYSTIGKKSFDEFSISISEKEFNELKEFSEELSDYLDNESDKNINKSGTVIGPSGELELGFDEFDIELDNLNNSVKKQFKDSIGKSYEFEISYYEWSGKSTNEFRIERDNLKIKDIRLEISMDKTSFIEIHTEFQNKDCRIYFPSFKNPTAYFDLDKNRTSESSKYLVMDPIKDEGLTRKQIREREKNETYPRVNYYNIVPSKYNTIEFLKSLKELMAIVDDEIQKTKIQEGVEYECGGWEECDQEKQEFIKEFFYDMIDEGLEIKIEQLVYKTESRYSITFKIDKYKDTMEWYKKNIVDLGRKFYDCCSTIGNQDNIEICSIRFNKSDSSNHFSEYELLICEER